MKLISLPDIHSHHAALTALEQPLREADVVILAGDLTNGRLDHAQALVQTVTRQNPRVLAIPGNMDTEQIVRYLGAQGMNIHRRHTLIDGIAFAGVGGSLYFAGPLQYSESELAAFLNEAIDGIPPGTPIVLVCHQPPVNTLNDVLENGQHVGSSAVRQFIEEYQPLLCLTGHIHSGVGVDKIGATTILNGGPFWRTSQYAYAEIEGGVVRVAEIRKI